MLFMASLATVVPATGFSAEDTAIDRRALVQRHTVVLTSPQVDSPLSVGNGEFAFTVDITGLQTFPEDYAQGMPLHTQSQWGWHGMPNPETYQPVDAESLYTVGPRQVPYADGAAGDDPRRQAATAWLRANPHRLDLGRAGMILRTIAGQTAPLSMIEDIKQTLDLWEGVIHSQFRYDDQPVQVETVCHPRRDGIGIRVQSPHIRTGRLGIRLKFPYGSGQWQGAADWEQPEKHQTRLATEDNRAFFERVLDDDQYWVSLDMPDGAAIHQVGPHEFEILGQGLEHLEMWVEFSPNAQQQPPLSFAEVRSAATQHWQRFWQEGGAVDLSQSQDPRWRELERRIVLSQYLTAIQCAGSMPPQETGLTGNSWHGKFHLEMHWWHAVHFALWNRLPLLERSLDWYLKVLPVARAKARHQGYQGARWPKMTGPEGRDSPSAIGEFLIWQQPHPIYYAELCYRQHPDKATLERYQALVFATAEFMADFPQWRADVQCYELGPPLIPAQECYDRTGVRNPTFEVAYWYWGLQTAQRWRQRLGLGRHAHWDHVLGHLPPLSMRDGVYTAVAGPPYTRTEDHPSMLAALGVVPPGPLVDPGVMRDTLEWVRQSWQWDRTWGWDYPMMAMCAARVGRPDLAVEALLMDTPKNRYLPNGHNVQGEDLPLYLPGNGGLLTAVAMMAAGWEGGPLRPAPGFPQDKGWVVRCEGLHPLP